MRSPARHRPIHLQPNLTSLIDVVFLLLVFFLLATTLVQENRVEMPLPAFDDRRSDKLPEGARLILNVLPAGDGAQPRGYAIDKDLYEPTPDGIASLGAALRAAKARNESVRVLLRAARDEPYENVHPAMQAVTLAGVSAVDLVTIPPDGELQRLIKEAGLEGAP